MDTPEATVRKNDADSSQPSFIVEFTISTKKWKLRIYEYISPTCAQAHDRLFTLGIPLIIKRRSLKLGEENVNIKVSGLPLVF